MEPESTKLLPKVDPFRLVTMTAAVAVAAVEAEVALSLSALAGTVCTDIPDPKKLVPIDE